jgi:hypothetical protein
MDITTLDSAEHAVVLQDNYMDRDLLNTFEDALKQQYINLDNLGIDLLENFNISNTDYKVEIYQNMLDYVNENYAAIVDFDAAMTSVQKLFEVGDYVYKFICVDCFNTVLPKFISSIDCIDISTFDSIIRTKFNYTYSTVKASLLKCVKSSSEELIKLQKIDPTVVNDAKYLRLVNRYSYYIELVDFGDTERFLNNYIRPVLSKNFAQILWRTM